MKIITIDYPDYNLEIHEDRGVIYINDKTKGNTIIRICGFKRPKREPRDRIIESIDITLDILK